MIRITQKIHRVLGLIGLVFILALTLTGVLLNHSEDLELYESYPESSVVLWLYGAETHSENFEEKWGDQAQPPSWEKVITAFHGGKFFGMKSNIFLDFLALIVLAISFTGPYVWFLKRKNNLLNVETGKPSDVEGELLDLLASLKTTQLLHAKTTEIRESLKVTMEKDVNAISEEMTGQLLRLDKKLELIHSNLDNLIVRIGALE